MKKSDIRNGMHVITKSGEEYIIMSDVYAPTQIDNHNTAKVVMLGLCGRGGWMNFDHYDDDLCFRDIVAEDDDYLYDINEVYTPNCYCWALESALEIQNKNHFTRLWKRGAKKMTKAEIEAELGYEIEIVESED